MLRFSLFFATVLVVSPSVAGEVSSRAVDMVRIQILNEQISSPETRLSAANLNDFAPNFRAFVVAVTEHVAIKLARDIHHVGDDKDGTLLQFIFWPLATSGNTPPIPTPLIDTQHSSSCRISSPWIDIVTERKPIPRVRAVIRWNQRQLLADQALLSGSKNVPKGIAIPLTQREFTHFAEEEYAASEILREPAAKAIEERVPPDLLWLFRRSWQSTRGPFADAARGSMDIAMRTGADSYTKLVLALVDHCFTIDQAELHFHSILDVANLISLQKYKINTPIR